MATRWTSSAAVAFALGTLGLALGACTRLPRPAEQPSVAPAAERPPIVEQHTSGQAPGSPNTVNAPAGAGALEREPTPATEVGEGADPVLEKIRDQLEAQADKVREQQ